MSDNDFDKQYMFHNNELCYCLGYRFTQALMQNLELIKLGTHSRLD